MLVTQAVADKQDCVVLQKVGDLVQESRMRLRLVLIIVGRRDQGHRPICRAVDL